jgi:hypothetical protein
MSYREGQLACDMRRECTEQVTMLDEKGYVYCKDHGSIRKYTMRCRKLSEQELEQLREGKPLAGYSGGVS